MTRSDIQHEAYMRYGNTDMAHWAELAFIHGAQFVVKKLCQMPFDEVVKEMVELSNDIDRFNELRKGGER